MPDAVPLTTQLACARRELALRERVYPRLVANETMLPEAATHELAPALDMGHPGAMRAICETLTGLALAEDGAGGQAELCGGTREEQV